MAGPQKGKDASHFRGIIEVGKTFYYLTIKVKRWNVNFIIFKGIPKLNLQDYCDAWIEESGWPGVLSWIPKIIYALSISVFDEAYAKVAVWLTFGLSNAEFRLRKSTSISKVTTNVSTKL